MRVISLVPALVSFDERMCSREGDGTTRLVNKTLKEIERSSRPTRFRSTGWPQLTLRFQMIREHQVAICGNPNGRHVPNRSLGKPNPSPSASWRRHLGSNAGVISLTPYASRVCFRFPFLTGPAPPSCCTSLIVPPLGIRRDEQLVLPPRTTTTLSLSFYIGSSSPNQLRQQLSHHGQPPLRRLPHRRGE